LKPSVYKIEKSVRLIRTVVGDVGPDLREIVHGARVNDDGGHLLLLLLRRGTAGSEELAAFAFHFRDAPGPSWTAVQAVTDIAAQLFQRYNSASEVVREALRIMETHDELQSLKLR
jgi:hypothetical protein